MPVALTAFIGRERELRTLRELAASSRLLTITGPGGSGKSRLALELIPDLPRAATWVELAPIADEALVAGAVLRALDPTAEAGAAAADRLIATLHDRDALLVLDNCEHVVDACADLVVTLLRACPRLHIIATSREALGVPGERAWLVPAMAEPDAVQLFVDRARDVAAEFVVTPSNEAAISAICARLDGVPLAIELAAARVRVMTPEQIRDRLGDAFALLGSGSRTALPRHRTLRATIDWSHDLLPDDARAVIRRLSVFRGGFTLDAAEAVASAVADGNDTRHHIGASEVLDLVARLADRSLLHMREQHGSARYYLLETVRQYAAQRLTAAGEDEQTQRAFARHVTELVGRIEPDLTSTRRPAAVARLEPELDNLRQVLHWTHEHDHPRHVLLAGMLWWFWFSTRHWLEARRWIDGALALPAAQQADAVRAKLLFAGGALSALQAQPLPARIQLAECLDICTASGERRLEAYALNYMAMTYAQAGGIEAREYSARAEAMLREQDDPYGLRLALLLNGMGEARAGNAARARIRMQEAVEIARSFGQDRELGVALQTLAPVVLDAGDVGEAEALVVEALHALRRDWSYLFVGRAVDMLALTIAGRDPGEAARRLGAGDALRQHVGADRFQLDQQRVDALVPVLRSTLGTAEFDRLHASGHTNAAAVVEDILAAPVRAAEAAEAADTGGANVAVVDAADGVTSAGADLRLRVLGSMEVWVHGVAIDKWPYAKPRELLAFLAAHPRGRTRQEVAAALWPDSTAAQARNTFHVTLHHLRKTLGEPDWIVLANDRYRIAEGIVLESDAVRFEEAVSTAVRDIPRPDIAVHQLRAALALYTGHYLEGEVAGRWRDDEQDRLRRIYADAALLLGERLENAGDTAAAIALYEDLILREPLLEEAHRRLIACWTDAGDRVRAIRHFDRLAELLRDDLQLEPDAETIALYNRARGAEQQREG